MPDEVAPLAGDNPLPQLFVDVIKAPFNLFFHNGIGIFHRGNTNMRF